MAEFTVTLQSGGVTFKVHPDELILDAALRQSVVIPYNCRNGTCRTCIFQVQEGTVEQLDANLCSITAQEIDANRRLICLSICKSDVVLERVLPRKRLKADEMVI